MKRNRMREGRARGRDAAERRVRRPRGALQALTTSALTLTGIANQALADGPADEIIVDYNRSWYEEDPISANKTIAGTLPDRYKVTMNQFGVRAPVPFTERFDFSFETVWESMSGASPMFLTPDAALQPVQVMSGPSISDDRRDYLLHLNYYGDDGRLGFDIGNSTENDYDSFNFGFDGDMYFNEKNTTVSAGIGFSFDDIHPTDPTSSPTRPTSESKDDYTLNFGISQVIGRAGLVQGNVTYKKLDGYLSDPYKQMFLVPATFLPDSRPSSRSQWSWTIKYRQYVDEMDGTLHLDYQYYYDDWDLRSHTVEASFSKTFFDDRVMFTPLVRFYTQSQARFFVPFFLAAPTVTEYSNDFRLSAYGALTLGFRAHWDLPERWVRTLRWGTFGLPITQLRLVMAYERYKSSEDFALDSALYEHPALVDFDVLTFGFQVRFPGW